MQVKDALQMYEGIVESTFKFIHCWYMLRNEMKWNEWLASILQAMGSNLLNLPRQAQMPHSHLELIGQMAGTGQRSRVPAALPLSTCLEVLQKMSMDRNAYEVRVEAATKEEAKDIASR